MTPFLAAPVATADYLEFHAGHRPEAAALVNGARVATYGRFHQDRVRFTSALAEFGLPGGALVAVSHPGVYVHWLLLLACETLGLVSASFARELEGAGMAPLLARADLVLADAPVELPRGGRFHRISEDWLAAIFARPPVADRPPVSVGPEDAVRVIRSSGTTGGQKMMRIARRVQENWLDNYLRLLGYSRDTRFLFDHRFTIHAVYLRATACLRLGATSLTGLAAAEIGARGCTDIWMQPAALEHLLAHLPAGWVKPARLRVEIGGAALPAALRERTLRELASEVIGFYGSNEAGSICELRSDGSATVLPGVELEIVDPRGAPVPDGEVGEIRLRSRTLIDGYLDNPDAEARVFRDGWFHPGDAARRLGPGRLRIVGRQDEVLNLGGLKLAPETVEGALRVLAGIADVAVTHAHDAEGVQHLRVAVVPAPGATLAALAEAVRRAMPFPDVKVAVLALDRLPRTESGKVRRHLLQARPDWPAPR